jgi:hypothetical protein
VYDQLDCLLRSPPGLLYQVGFSTRIHLPGLLLYQFTYRVPTRTTPTRGAAMATRGLLLPPDSPTRLLACGGFLIAGCGYLRVLALCRCDRLLGLVLAYQVQGFSPDSPTGL